MSKERGFDARLLWRDDGHLGDAALTCFVDGEEAILPAPAAAHLDTCEPCAARLGDLAIAAVQTVELLAARMPVATEAAAPAPVPLQALAASPARNAAPSRRPPVRVPFWAVAAALILAGLGAAPAALDALHALPAWLLGVSRALPVLLQSVGFVVRHGGAALLPALAVSALGSLILVVFAASVARRMSRKAPLEGGI
jgi:hypothetical protein